MSSPDKIKAIVLTCDRFRAITRHLISNTSGCGRITRLFFMFHTRNFAEPTPTGIKYHAAPRTSRGPSCICSQTSMTKNGFTGAWTTNTRFNFPPTR
jgi:hypothetical protein